MMNQTYKMHCVDPWFSLIREGKKPVEGRKNSPTWQKLRIGDSIEFDNGKETFTARIEKLDRFDSVEDYLESVGLEKALPGIASIEEGKKIYLKWSTQAEIDRWGFLAIWVTHSNEKKSLER